jgi:hypothetical protein
VKKGSVVSLIGSSPFSFSSSSSSLIVVLFLALRGVGQRRCCQAVLQSAWQYSALKLRRRGSLPARKILGGEGLQRMLDDQSSPRSGINDSPDRSGHSRTPQQHNRSIRRAGPTAAGGCCRGCCGPL